MPQVPRLPRMSPKFGSASGAELPSQADGLANVSVHAVRARLHGEAVYRSNPMNPAIEVSDPLLIPISIGRGEPTGAVHRTALHRNRAARSTGIVRISAWRNRVCRRHPTDLRMIAGTRRGCHGVSPSRHSLRNSRVQRTKRFSWISAARAGSVYVS